ncbi:hypothetical protein RIR_e53257_A0A2N1NBY5_9GLOM [Rhizophagus irregularis DAOM 181602=DAOM 197198]|nr:hypothetical protein RIR_e53257_A0A2N1NBY5_9GLOM [Rhizophagus irregularis DAOM 181602=DAOM 197198]
MISMCVIILRNLLSLLPYAYFLYFLYMSNAQIL